MVRNRSKLHANMMVVKGVQWEVQATMEATGLLMNYMCGPLAVSVSVVYEGAAAQCGSAAVRQCGSSNAGVLCRARRRCT